MIHRYVFVKLKDSADRERVAAAAHEALNAVPVVHRATVGRPADADAEVWDLVFVVEIPRYEDVQTYADDPIHVAFVQTHLNPAAEVKKAWNFTIGDSQST